MDRRPEIEDFLQKTQKSRDVIQRAVESFGADGIAVSWGGDLESIVLLYLIKHELGDVLLPVVHFDTAVKYTAFHAMRDQIVKEWTLDLTVRLMDFGTESEKEKEADVRVKIMNEHGWRALLVPATSENLSQGNQDDYFGEPHNRIHVIKPLAHLNTADIQLCREMFAIPDPEQYDRDFGQPPTHPEEDNPDSEETDLEEQVKQRLRDLGYL
jgi:hypothetical protein